ncbi:hypothetical protein M3Y97_00922200 [Aphelenchoides bicaudatus]|nr:hypothetical protein M3Y97_00922200 [Aphelenchoides bicaudatus]
MDDRQRLRQLIRSQISDGKSQEEAINNLLAIFGFGEEYLDYVYIKWFKSIDDFDTNESWNEWFLNQDCNLFDMLDDEYENAAKTIMSRRKCLADKCKMVFLTERYAIDGCEKDGCFVSLQLFDCLYEQQIELTIEGEFLERLEHSNYKIFPIDSDHFLFFAYGVETNDPKMMYLMRLVINEIKCVVLDWMITEHEIKNLVVDEKDPQKFVLYIRYYETYYLQSGHIKNSKLEIDERMFDLDIHFYIHGFRMEGSTLYALSLSFDQEADFIFYKIIMDPVDIQSMLICEFIDHTHRWNNIDKLDVVWSSNTCYVSLKYHERENALYEFNIKSKEMTKIGKIDDDKFVDFRFDGDKFIACKREEQTKQHVMKRLPLSQSDTPNTLLDLTLLRIVQHAKFLDENLFSQLTNNNLPLKLRPFGR